MTNEVKTTLTMRAKNGTLVYIDLEYKETNQVVAKTCLTNVETSEPRVRETKWVLLNNLERKYKELIETQEDWVAETLQELVDNGIVHQIINNCEYYLHTQQVVLCLEGKDYMMYINKNHYYPDEIRVYIGEIPTIKDFNHRDGLITVNINWNENISKEDTFNKVRNKVLDKIINDYDISKEKAITLIGILRTVYHNKYYINDLFWGIREVYRNANTHLDINWNDNKNSKVVKETEKSIRGINLLMEYLSNDSSLKQNLNLDDLPFLLDLYKTDFISLIRYLTSNN